ncbi:DODA-type extradiol aromatic ring-opening family dioxygenase [Noviherbaspirillum pedocola]|uniref:Dioxygenase n=1 Tax=Noviherbaspirillum pedocola TaxID=2801341 RepID=A0A934SZJ1_9BURK|nr:class III extradiol ring-cleavage dioxygenase [Noviherbaspirillum pedocola]MBK4738170.1 dioxygenase [Noviherbaspirillum pedocola]
MNSSLPTLFISHGSPMLALQDSPARRFLERLGRELPRPDAILIVSAHWETPDVPALSLAEHPETIHDFRGFPPELFAMQYPAPGAPQLAARAAAMLKQASFAVRQSATRGLDHGAWVPLRLMFPEADIPVTQLSLVHGATPAEHFRLGQAIAALRAENVLVIGSGSMTHNLYELRREGGNAPAPAWVTEFTAWMDARLAAGEHEALLDYRRRAPHAADNHPSEEHLLPLFVALGAGGGAARRLHASVEYGVLAMDVYAFP